MQRLISRIADEFKTWKPVHAVLGFFLANLLGAAWIWIEGATLIGQWMFLVALQVAFLAVSEWIRRSIAQESKNEKRLALVKDRLRGICEEIPPDLPTSQAQLDEALRIVGLHLDDWKDETAARLRLVVSDEIATMYEQCLSHGRASQIALSFLKELIEMLDVDDLRKS